MAKLSFMLANEYHKGMTLSKDTSPYSTPPLSWYMSEKYDGYRARFNSKDRSFYSRQNKLFSSPEWFRYSIPEDVCFDGELWAGRENFQLMGVVRKKIPIDEEWMNIQYIVYDLPTLNESFETRYQKLQTIVADANKRWNRVRKELEYPLNTLECPLVLATQIKITSEPMMESYYQKIIQEGGEGIMIKHPLSEYSNGRTSMMLKYKPTFDAEAIIIDYKEGCGKYKGMLGGFICQPLLNHGTYSSLDTDESHIFSMSGMDDSIRKNYKKTHPVNTIITYEYSGITDGGKPRFARYLRKRTDITIKEHTSCKNIRSKIIEQLTCLSEYEKIKGSGFKVSAYQKAIQSLETLDDSDVTLSTITKLPGIGSSMIQKIKQILDTGSCDQYDAIKDYKDPRQDFLKIYGVGPKKANDIYNLGLQSIDDIRNYDNLDTLLNEKQKIGLLYYEDINSRIPRSEISKHDIYLQTIISKLDPSAKLTIAGSYRRGKKNSGDIDILLTSENTSTYKRFITILKQDKYLQHHLAEGNTKYMGLSKLKNHRKQRRIDIMFTPPEEYPFAILYFTGSKEFNTKMRQHALDIGYTMNEHGIQYTDKSKTLSKIFTTEQDIFTFLQYIYVDPTER